MSTKIFGYAGKFLRVNLTSRRISQETFDEVVLRKYVGGTGIGAKILYDEVPPEAEFDDPENRLILASGPLGGTSVPGSGGFSVVTKGALTNGAATTQANGFFGVFLKLSGFDGIILQGRSPDWVYLYIENGKAELRNAVHLIGKGTYETDDLIRKELGKNERQMSIASIGPAGENLVKFAGILADKAHAASHNGVGAVMGSKKLKAIATARGNTPLRIFDGKKLANVAGKILEVAKTSETFKYGTLYLLPWILKMGALPVKNYSMSTWPIKSDELNAFGCDQVRKRFKTKRNPCWACQQHHCEWMTLDKEPYAGKVVDLPEYENICAFSSNIGNTDAYSAIVLGYLADDLGLEANEASFVISWVMECYEKGLISEEQTEGLEMTWGNVATTKKMLEKISNREGFGNLLAEGVMRAAKRIGGRAASLAVFNEKGNTTRTSMDHRYKWWELVDTCVSNTGTIENYPMPAEIGAPELVGPAPPMELSAGLARYKGLMLFEDSLGVCHYNTRSKITLLAEGVSAATGWNFTSEEANDAGLRFANLLRAFNIKCGITPSQEYPSARYCSTPTEGPAKGKSIMPHWEQMMDNYYELMGWDRKTGKPLAETLKKLGLDHVAKDLWASK